MKRQLMRRRYENRASIDDFVRPILNIDILDRFQGKSRHDFRPLDPNFDDHRTYLEKWEHLFMYETYNMLLNSRRTTDKEDDHAARVNAQKSRAQEARAARSSKKKYWEGYVVTSQKETLFQTLRMYDKPPGPSDKVGEEKSEAFEIRQLREYDLIVLSEEPIDLKGGDDIKQVSSVNFLRSQLLQHNIMFGFVTKRAAKNGFALLQVDISKAFFLDTAEMDDSCVKMHCYHFENLSTTVREYKTLKMCEFFKMAPIFF